jgi:hypothetical protein
MPCKLAAPAGPTIAGLRNRGFGGFLVPYLGVRPADVLKRTMEAKWRWQVASPPPGARGESSISLNGLYRRRRRWPAARRGSQFRRAAEIAQPRFLIDYFDLTTRRRRSAITARMPRPLDPLCCAARMHAWTKASFAIAGALSTKG